MNKGFTLIELLVVVAIIGILTTIVLAALGGSRDRARYTSAQASFQDIRKAATIYVVDNESFAGVCSDPEISSLFFDGVFPYTNSGSACFVSPNGSQFVMYSNIVPAGEWWCVDGEGSFNKYPNAPYLTDYACP